MMIKFQSLSIVIKSSILVFFLIGTGFVLNLFAQSPDNIILQILSFLLIFTTLCIIFNFIDFKIYNKIFIGLTIGVLAGLIFGEQIQIFEPVGKAFIKLIKMIERKQA